MIAQLLNTSLEGIHYQWATKPQGRPTSSWIDSDSLEIVVDDDDLPGQVFFRMVYGDQYSQTYSIRLWQILIPAFNAPVLAQSNGSLLCLGKEGNESLDVKSGENSSPSCYITVEGHGMYFESPPYQDELFQRLLSFPDIVERIKTLRPWGTESMLLLPATIQIEGDESVYEHTITILAE